MAVQYGGKVYACRHFHKLAYQTQREQAHDRAGSRSDTIRKRLGWDAGILNGNGNKPKGIRRWWEWRKNGNSGRPTRGPSNQFVKWLLQRKRHPYRSGVRRIRLMLGHLLRQSQRKASRIGLGKNLG